jgi:hypothetical protein
MNSRSHHEEGDYTGMLGDPFQENCVAPAGLWLQFHWGIASWLRYTTILVRVNAYLNMYMHIYVSLSLSLYIYA